MRITFHTHACAEIQAGPVTLLTDPWLTDRPFHRGWALALPPAEHPGAILRRATHIWLSKEHESAFSPASLEMGPRKAEILYQETPEKNVLRACQKLGYRVSELSSESQRTRSLGAGVNGNFIVTFGHVGLYSAWGLFEYGGQRILSLADCDVEPEQVRAAIGERPVDVLLTPWQVSRACGDAEDIKAMGERMLDLAERYVRELKPAFTIPFGGFARFSHHENRWMDPHTNRIDQIFERIAKTDSYPMILRPGETFDLNNPNQREIVSGAANECALKKWRTAYSIPVNDEGPAPVRTFGQLRHQFGAFCRGLAKRNGHDVMNLISSVVGPLRVDVADWGDPEGVAIYELLLNGEYSRPSSREVDISLTPDALYEALRNLWGFDHLIASGRVRGTREGIEHLIRWSDVATRNQHGYVAGARIAFGKVPEKPLEESGEKSGEEWTPDELDEQARGLSAAEQEIEAADEIEETEL